MSPRDDDLMEDYCPNCGQYVGGESECPRCGGKIFDDKELEEFDEEAEEESDEKKPAFPDLEEEDDSF